MKPVRVWKLPCKSEPAARGRTGRDREAASNNDGLIIAPQNEAMNG